MASLSPELDPRRLELDNPGQDGYAKRVEQCEQAGARPCDAESRLNRHA
jgi:hypothetical protein